jgi:hypothetical protein
MIKINVNERPFGLLFEGFSFSHLNCHSGTLSLHQVVFKHITSGTVSFLFSQATFHPFLTSLTKNEFNEKAIPFFDSYILRIETGTGTKCGKIA